MDDDEDYFVAPQLGSVHQLTDKPIENPPPRRPIGFITKFPSTQQSRPVAKRPQRRSRKR